MSSHDLQKNVGEESSFIIERNGRKNPRYRGDYNPFDPKVIGRTSHLSGQETAQQQAQHSSTHNKTHTRPSGSAEYTQSRQTQSAGSQKQAVPPQPFQAPQASGTMPKAQVQPQTQQIPSPQHVSYVPQSSSAQPPIQAPPPPSMAGPLPNPGVPRPKKQQGGQALRAIIVAALILVALPFIGNIVYEMQDSSFFEDLFDESSSSTLDSDEKWYKEQGYIKVSGKEISSKLSGYKVWLSPDNYWFCEDSDAPYEYGYWSQDEDSTDKLKIYGAKRDGGDFEAIGTISRTSLRELFKKNGYSGTISQG